jgi:hypothetical protein
MADQAVRTRVASTDQVSAMLWNSSVAYVLANMVVIVLHESAHTVAGLVQGYQATQFTGEVRFTPGQTTTALVITALAGPLFSLVSGLLAMTFHPFRRHGFAHLLWIWIAFLSAEEGFGYLTIAPFITAGDTGAALSALKAPGWVGWICSAVGIAGLVFLARQFAVRGVRHTRDLYEIRAFCFYPWLIGTGVSMALVGAYLAFTPATSSAAVFAIMVGTASLGVFAPMAMMFWQKVQTTKHLLELRTPRAGIAAAVALALGNLLVLARGIHFG